MGPKNTESVGSIKVLSIAYLLGLTLLLVGCGTQAPKPATPQAGAEPTTEEGLFAAAGKDGTVTNTKIKAMQAKLATIKSNAQACAANAACLNQKVDELVIALSNRLASPYQTVAVGITGGVNANGTAGAGYATRILANSPTGYAITNSSGAVFQGVPVSGRAGVAAAVYASKPGLYPYLGAAFVFVDSTTGTIAVAGADVSGYSYCYVAIGVAPLCYSAGW